MRSISSSDLELFDIASCDYDFCLSSSRPTSVVRPRNQFKCKIDIFSSALPGNIVLFLGYTYVENLYQGKAL